MSKKTKEKKTRPRAKPNEQIPISLVRRAVAGGQDPLLQHARDYPFYGCWLMEDWESQGFTLVVVARQPEPGRVLFGSYLVDLYCLGVKDAFTRTDYSVKRFERELPKFLGGAPTPCSVEQAHEMIYGAIEYAEKLGFQPHPDFKRRMADQVLDPPDAHPRSGRVPFGKDGKPFFVAGPYDDARTISRVLNTLARTCGEGNFDYLVGTKGEA